MDRAFSPDAFIVTATQAVGLGWYGPVPAGLDGERKSKKSQLLGTTRLVLRFKVMVDANVIPLSSTLSSQPERSVGDLRFPCPFTLAK
jgi:hypothetical protein